MKLREFVKIAEDKGFGVEQSEKAIDIEWKDTPCAMVSLVSESECWINTSNIRDVEVRAILNRLVSAFANTPLNSRNEKVIAAHKNGSYVRDISRKKVDKPAFVIEMTDKLDEANEHINARQRKWLDELFGDKIYYLEEY